MHHSTVIVYLSAALLTCKLAVCDWTFSLRISSAVCCNSTTCEQVGTCDGLFVSLCFRDPNRIRVDRVTCPRFIGDDGQNIVGRELTPSSFVTANLIPAGITRQDAAYLGGFQIFAGVLTTADIPPYNDDDIIDVLFIEVVSIAGGGESSMMAYGENGRVNVSLSAISVQCIEGFSGDDCETVNTCNEQITCNETLGYCNTDGDCICFDECPTVIETPTSIRCRLRDLLCTDNSCDPEYQTSDDGTFIACSEDGNLCVMSNSERAQYNFSMSYCLLNGSQERMCEEDIREWTGSVPFLLHVCDENLPEWNIAVIALAVIFFIIGVGIAGILGMLLFFVARKSVVKKWYKVMLAACVIIIIMSLIIWLALIGYTASNEFCEEDDGYLRGSNSQCEPPSGDNAVRDALVIVSCVLSLLVLIEWSVSAALWRYGVITDTDSAKAPPLSPPVIYEEVGVAEEIMSTHNIQLQSNEAYGPISPPVTNEKVGVSEEVKSTHNIQLQSNEAYGPISPPVTNEEVGVSEEVKSTHNIQLQSNEAYGPIQRDNIHTSPNTAYGQVQL